MRESIRTLLIVAIIVIWLCAIAFVEAKEAIAAVVGAVVLAAVLVWCFNTPCRPTPAPEPVSISILEQ
jgi:hypothetical protein